jgi:uncharacterized protein YbbC (DUF1343 family)
VLFEATNISEGRGTTMPFQLFGAPFMREKDLQRMVSQDSFEGVVLRPVCFEPVFDKWRGRTCFGFQIHIVDPYRVHPYRLGLSLLQALCQAYPEQFGWLPPPYEYETEKLPIDILLGNGELRQRLEAGEAIGALEESWQDELGSYWQRCEGFVLYR